MHINTLCLPYNEILLKTTKSCGDILSKNMRKSNTQTCGSLYYSLRGVGFGIDNDIFCLVLYGKVQVDSSNPVITNLGLKTA